MRVIIELEGAIFDIREAFHRAHVDATREVGWSSLDERTFWRLLRKEGREANMLPGARPIKTKQYLENFAANCENDTIIGAFQVEPKVPPALRSVSQMGTVCGVTLGSNVEARSQLVQTAGLADRIERAECLATDPRRRPAELRILAGSEPRTVVVVAASDAIARAAGAAELFTVGISCGTCIAARLHQAGADLVYGSLADFAEALDGGAPELVRRGLLPPS